MEHAPLWSWKGFGVERGERHQLTTGFHSESPSASLKCFSFLFEAQIGTLYLSWEKEVFQTEKKMIVVTTSLEKEKFSGRIIIVSLRIMTSDRFFFYLDSK